jgi:ABC-type nitrate/sulfonate/bicarbonate transport system substrate-binding protein
MKRVRAQTSRRSVLPLAWFFLVAACVGMISSGCGRKTVSSSDAPAKIKICYLGLACEPAIFVAYEKGFFMEEGGGRRTRQDRLEFVARRPG